MTPKGNELSANHCPAAIKSYPLTRKCWRISMWRRMRLCFSVCRHAPCFANLCVGTDADLRRMSIGNLAMANAMRAASGLNFDTFRLDHSKPGAWLNSA
jgi:hypothetical protein